MANITNVTLTLQHGGAQNPSSQRTATVQFTTRFSEAEVEERVLYNAEIVLQPRTENNSEDGFNYLLLPATSVQATALSVTTSITESFLRSRLDEDPDFIRFRDLNGKLHIINLGNQIDEWRARVTLTPVRTSIRRNSPLATGGWGTNGND